MNLQNNDSFSYSSYRLQSALRNWELKKMSGYFNDFWFNAPDNTEALKDNDETDRMILDMFAGSTVL